MAGELDILPEQQNISMPEGGGETNPSPIDGSANMFDHPVPGQSLARSPEVKAPFEKPPEFTSEEEVIDFLFERFTSAKGFRQISKMLKNELPVEDVVQVFLFEMFRQGKITPDLMLLLIEPVMHLIILLADQADIKVNLYPESEDDPDFLDSEDLSKFTKTSSKNKIEEEDQGDIEDLLDIDEGNGKDILSKVKGDLAGAL